MQERAIQVVSGTGVLFPVYGASLQSSRDSSGKMVWQIDFHPQKIQPLDINDSEDPVRLFNKLHHDYKLVAVSLAVRSIFVPI
jgi:hypothetical protein